MPMLQSFLTWIFMIYLQVAGIGHIEPGQITEYYNLDDTLRITIVCADISEYDGGGWQKMAGMYAEGYEDDFGDYLTYMYDEDENYYWDADLEGSPFLIYDPESDMDYIFITPDPLYPHNLVSSEDYDEDDGTSVFFSEYQNDEGMYVNLWDTYSDGSLVGFEVGFDWEETGLSEVFYEVFDEWY